MIPRGSEEIVTLVVGGVILLFGRRLYWLCLGGFGFLCGMVLGGMFLDKLETWAVILIALVLGLIGMVAVLILQKITIVLAGAIGGGLLIVTVVQEFWPPASPEFLWIYFIAGAFLGGLLVMSVFQWALILLSAGTGSAMIVRSLVLDSNYEALALLLIFIVGFVVQASSLKRHTRASSDKQNG